MKLLKTPNKQRIDGKKPIDWLSIVTDDRAKLAIPVGPRFQVDIPSWNPPSRKSRLTTKLDDESKWLGTPVWPLKGKTQTTRHSMVGRGRPRECRCAFPGSIECIKRHVSDKRLQLKIELGPAFWKWRFDVMGEDVSKVWNQEEEREFDCVVKKNLTSCDKSFVEAALQCFPSQSKGSIVSYYLNVYIPRRMSVQTRSSCKFVDTDDEDEDEDADDDDDNNHDNNDDDGREDTFRSEGSLKRLRDDFTSSTRKYMKAAAYLTSCR